MTASVANATLTLGASCAVNVGPVPGLSRLRPSDSGPWPWNGGAVPQLTAGDLGQIKTLIAGNLQSLQSCGL